MPVSHGLKAEPLLRRVGAGGSGGDLEESVAPRADELGAVPFEQRVGKAAKGDRAGEPSEANRAATLLVAEGPADLRA